MKGDKVFKNYGRPQLAEDVEAIHFKLPKKEYDDFIKLCEKKEISISHRLQLLVARDLYHEEKNEL